MIFVPKSDPLDFSPKECMQGLMTILRYNKLLKLTTYKRNKHTSKHDQSCKDSWDDIVKCTKLEKACLRLHNKPNSKTRDKRRSHNSSMSNIYLLKLTT
jgi:hypothetical protein